MKSLVLLAVLAAAGCGVEPDPASEPVTIEPFDSNAAVDNDCVYSGGSYWCQDWYTDKWCTNSVNESAWDYTGCTWTGWSASGVFCGTNVPGYAAGWSWGQAHTHCPG
jgi:hypothetical protein